MVVSVGTRDLSKNIEDAVTAGKEIHLCTFEAVKQTGSVGLQQLYLDVMVS